ncbi:hypothetical protein BMS3Bbin04_00781 [bacterium BMS3Bbin04]|nr:hypothetical protein BMS3Bbin04_00781 [bacterium BMS3Bbin04]
MKHNILIVDDSAMARMFIQRCFEIAGWQDASFFQAGNGREALEMLKDKAVDLVLSDLNMPEMTGEELLVSIKESKELASIPVIIITSLSNTAKREQLLKWGASAVMPKPVSPASLAEALELVFGEADD